MPVNLSKVTLLFKLLRYLFSALAVTITTPGRSSVVLPTATTGQAGSTLSPIRTTYTSSLQASAHRVGTVAATVCLSVALPAKSCYYNHNRKGRIFYKLCRREEERILLWT